MQPFILQLFPHNSKTLFNSEGENKSCSIQTAAASHIFAIWQITHWTGIFSMTQL